MRRVGSGKFIYEEVKEWGQFPDGWTVQDVPGVAVDSQDRVYAYTRHKLSAAHRLVEERNSIEKVVLVP